MEDTEIINLFFARSEDAASQCQRKGPEEEAWQKQPGNYISYGSDQVEQTNVAFLCWEKEGVRIPSWIWARSFPWRPWPLWHRNSFRGKDAKDSRKGGPFAKNI